MMHSILPRKGELIQVVGVSRAIVDKVLPNGQLLVTTDRVFRKADDTLTNQIVVEQALLYIPVSGGYDGTVQG
jgi:hypothetical protein